MSAHPHPGRRSEWRYVRKEPPTLAGDYEMKCPDEVFPEWISYLMPSDIDWPCDKCQWRGLAEEPK